MKYLLGEKLKEEYPDFNFAFSEVKNITVVGPNEETNRILTDIYPKILAKYSMETLLIHPNSIAYTNFAKLVGISPESAFLPHLQIRRILKGKQIGNINNIVNSYMAFELLYNLSFAAYDLDTIDGDITVDCANGGEEIIIIGGEKCIIPSRDLVFSDSTGPFYSFSQGYRDSSKITPITNNVLFTIDAPKGIKRDIIISSIKELSEKFKHYEITILPI